MNYEKNWILCCDMIVKNIGSGNNCFGSCIENMVVTIRFILYLCRMMRFSVGQFFEFLPLSCIGVVFPNILLCPDLIIRLDVLWIFVDSLTLVWDERGGQLFISGVVKVLPQSILFFCSNVFSQYYRTIIVLTLEALIYFYFIYFYCWFRIYLCR